MDLTVIIFQYTSNGKVKFSVTYFNTLPKTKSSAFYLDWSLTDLQGFVIYQFFTENI